MTAVAIYARVSLQCRLTSTTCPWQGKLRAPFASLALCLYCTLPGAFLFMELTDIKKALSFEGHSPERRICEAIGQIDIAKRGGGDIRYLTRTEERALANLGDLIFVARELVRIMDTPLERLIPNQTPLMAFARDLLHNLNVQPDAEPPAASSPPNAEHSFTLKIHSSKTRQVIEQNLVDVLDPLFANYWIGHEASSPPNPASEIGSEIHAAAASSAPSQPLAQTMQKLRDLSQAMLGVLDCKNPDGTARGEALAAWIELRETLDVLWLDPPLAGR